MAAPHWSLQSPQGLGAEAPQGAEAPANSVVEIMDSRSVTRQLPGQLMREQEPGGRGAHGELLTPAVRAIPRLVSSASDNASGLTPDAPSLP